MLKYFTFLAERRAGFESIPPELRMPAAGSARVPTGAITTVMLVTCFDAPGQRQVRILARLVGSGEELDPT
jgi:hypothetical protein